MFKPSRNSLLVGLIAIAFAASGYKILNRPPDAVFITPALKASPDTQRQLSKVQTQFVSSVPGRAVHAASLVELRDGSLRAVWFSGSREGAGDVTIQTAVLSNGAQKWGLESSLFDRPQLQRGLWRYVKKIGNPVIARAPDGTLHLWMVNVSLGGWAGSAITWSQSSDEGSTWSHPKRIVTSPFLNISTLIKGAPVGMTNGQISLPVYHEFITKFAEVLRLDAQGRVIDQIRIPNSHTALQPVLLVENAQSAQAFMRSGQGGLVVTSRTDDAGKTWAAASATALPNPNSALAGVVAMNGDKWLALNLTATGRSSLTLVKAKAGDGFRNQPFFGVEPLTQPGPQSQGSQTPSTSQYEAMLSAELKASGATDEQIAAFVLNAKRQLCGQTTCALEFSYPSLLQTRDGLMHLVYTWNRTRIKHVSFPASEPSDARPNQ